MKDLKEKIHAILSEIECELTVDCYQEMLDKIMEEINYHIAINS